ncbi:hypothetical protein EF808_06755 [archaeon]|nr:MAG: hypothetical protein EF808_06755 [archaeon]
MSTVFALNNSPYYYVNPLMLGSIGLTVPTTARLVRKLAILMRSLADANDGAFLPGIQLGVESDRALRSASGQRALSSIREEYDVSYIVHFPDYLVPGPSGHTSMLGHALSFLPAHLFTPRMFSDAVLERLDAAHAIGSETLVMHLPAMRERDAETVLTYFTPRNALRLQDNGQLLSIENCNNKGNPYFGDIEPIQWLLSCLGDRYGFCFDFGHYIVERGSIDNKALRLAARTAAVHHVHINDRRSDAHLFLGERPDGFSRTKLEAEERIYVDEVLSNVDPDNTVFVMERNRPFDPAQLEEAIRRLRSALSL